MLHALCAPGHARTTTSPTDPGQSNKELQRLNKRPGHSAKLVPYHLWMLPRVCVVSCSTVPTNTHLAQQVKVRSDEARAPCCTHVCHPLRLLARPWLTDIT